MSIINEITLKSIKNTHINFEVGNLSSDAGLLLMKEFFHKLGVEKLAKANFQTTDPGRNRFHKDHENLLQSLFQIMAAYFQDDHADALRNDPAITTAVGKEALASQPTLSRFYNRLDEKTLGQLEKMLRVIRKRAYAVKMPEHVILDLDSTLFATFGKQEGGAFNFHYQANGYHPLLCYDGMTGDLLKIELRPGTQYCCNGAAEFMRPLLEEYQENYPNIALFLRGDSGFATDELYRVCEDNGTSYVIRLKENEVLRKLAKELDEELYDLTQTREDAVSCAVVYGEF